MPFRCHNHMKNLFKSIFILTILCSGLNAHSQETLSNRQFRREFLNDINRVRESGCNCGGAYMPPVPPLIWNDNLEIAAIGHARDMADRNYFNHTSKDGRSMEDRITLAGYTFKGYKSFMAGENIAQGQTSIQEVMQGWFKSPGHCKNLMNPAFKEVGVAEYNTYWVQDFGGRVPFSAEQQRLLKSGRARLIEANRE
ncbi:MAG: hypothetical protein JWR02_2843 [Mucilaginibacter sp.]|nr:hypothetical protein [Mucilaginibacter sp.]